MQSISYPDGSIKTQLYLAEELRPLYKAMDDDLAKAEAQGGRLAHRAEIGRNSPCPCRSGRKFKKCCMPNARVINTI